MNRNHVFSKYTRRTRKLQRNLKFAHLGAQTKTISELYFSKRMNMFQSIMLESQAIRKNKNSEMTTSEQLLILRTEINRTRKIQEQDEQLSESDSSDNMESIEEDTIGSNDTEDESSYKSIKIWTDGACSNNGQPFAKAGYGVYFAGSESDERNISERLPGDKQTNQRAELMASISALEKVIATERSSQNLAVIIYSDSKYVIDGITIWAHNWNKSDWNVPKVNLDLWKWLYRLTYHKRKNLRIDWVHVRGHIGIYGNERADELARAGVNRPLSRENKE
jgi:ribonuclease HI